MITDPEQDQCDIDLEYVKKKRISIIEALTEKKVPEDPKELGLLLIALSDMDRATLSKKKIKVDKEAGSNQEQAMLLISSLFNDPRVKAIGKSAEVTDRIIPLLSPNIDAPILVDGETDSNSGTESFDSFTKRVDGLNE